MSGNRPTRPNNVCGEGGQLQDALEVVCIWHGQEPLQKFEQYMLKKLARRRLRYDTLIELIYFKTEFWQTRVFIDMEGLE